ncbi:hypothetical protein MGYG_05833 [Nannizzia gypsea CBS 118893]|uniref:Uncharacterized protein n=1 Tax=Arthroderma gypseum (strain ATCC MYA-4604 / CBS 118893) TaxID=535722 RepID=E4UY53_ARTGP|nr:hypothetical protein MGYG_05833 [Nannizzia gypsea CBS 118893]EFR02833.1 hypothetical protein MGYG_05833 [Nannizzia gypsea CBS 118893]
MYSPDVCLFQEPDTDTSHEGATSKDEDEDEDEDGGEKGEASAQMNRRRGRRKTQRKAQLFDERLANQGKQEREAEKQPGQGPGFSADLAGIGRRPWDDSMCFLDERDEKEGGKSTLGGTAAVKQLHAAMRCTTMDDRRGTRQEAAS